MTKSDTTDQSNNNLETRSLEVLKGSATLASLPVVICGVSRKVNTGNFENIDVYTGVSLPVGIFPEDEDFEEAIAKAVAQCFDIASSETGQRYTLIKEMQSGS